MKANIYHTDFAVHPGDFLKEVLDDIGMSQDELSDRLSLPVQVINEIIKMEKNITPTIALKLENVLGIPSHIWIGLEKEYEIALAKIEESKKTPSFLPSK